MKSTARLIVIESVVPEGATFHFGHKNLSEKVSIVTAASKGIGAEIAKQLAAAGAAVIVNYNSSKKGGEHGEEARLSFGGYLSTIFAACVIGIGPKELDVRVLRPFANLARL